MIVRDIKTLYGTQREVKGNGWTSTRLLLKKDGMGFSVHETIIPAGEELHLHYKNHLEAVYCIEGNGSVKDLETGETHSIFPGVIYALDKNDKHILCAQETLRFVCVFNPPVTGAEVHDAYGAYPVIEDEEEGHKKAS
ncbi:ectoine synthase [Rickettsiales bacterium]|nr:ectoine synthase [Rickettsiales bacterium]